MHSVVRLACVCILGMLLSGCQLVAVLPSGATLPSDGTCAEYAVVARDGQAISQEVLDQALDIIESRIQATGVADPVVYADDAQRLWVGFPGLSPEAVDEVRGLITTPGVVEFVPVPAAYFGQPSEGLPLPAGMADVEALFGGDQIELAGLGQVSTTDEIVVNLQLKETGARIFDEYASSHFGEQFAIVLDGIVQSAPSINARRFEGQAQISGGAGGFSPDEAQALVTVLRFGSLPLEIREIDFGACS